MKLSLWLCATLWLLFSSLAAELVSQAEWETWRDNRALSAHVEHTASPQALWRSHFLAESQNESDGSFDRTDHQGRFRWVATRQLRGFSGGFVVQADRAQDESKSADSRYEYKRFERSIGLRLSGDVTRGFSTQNEWRWGWREEESSSTETNGDCEGLRGESSLVWNGQWGAQRFLVSSGFTYADLEQDASRLWRYNLQWSAPYAKHQINANLNYTDESEDIYQNFERSDTRKRENWHAETRYATQALPIVEVRANAFLDKLDNRFDVSSSRNYEQDNRRLDLSLSAPLRGWVFRMTGVRGRLDKTYETHDHDLKQEEWSVEGEAAWAFTSRDTLRFVRGERLIRSDMPYASLRTDNDLLENNWSLSGSWFARDRILVEGEYAWRKAERIYIDALMSGENNRRTRHVLQPALYIAPGAGFLIEQRYTLLANYDDYVWNYDRQDRFYRQFTGEFRLAWDQSPDLSTVSDINWMFDAGVSPLSPWRAEGTFVYVQSEGGDWEDDHYLIDDEQERYEATVNLGRAAYSFDWSVGAEMIWDVQRDLRLPLTFVWRWRDIRLQGGVTPQCAVGEDDDEIEWRASVQLQSSF